MPKDAKKETKNNRGIKLETSQQSKAYVQQVNKQAQVLLANCKQKLEALETRSPDKSYMTIFTKNDFQKTSPVQIKHPLDNLTETEYTYDPKTKKDRSYNPKHRPQQTKDLYQFPMTSNQSYGWRQPIDVFSTNFGIKSTLGEGFNKPSEKGQKKN